MFFKGSVKEMLNLSQQDYVKRIEELNQVMIELINECIMLVCNIARRDGTALMCCMANDGSHGYIACNSHNKLKRKSINSNKSSHHI